MKRRVSKRLRALEDLADAGTYLEEHTSGAGLRFLEAAEHVFQDLLEAPTLGPGREFLNPKLSGLRSWRIRGFEKWLIFYRPIDDGIEIIRVLHGARDLQNALSDEEE